MNTTRRSVTWHSEQMKVWCSTPRTGAVSFRASARDPKLSHAEALRQSMLAMIDAAKSDAEADPRLWAPFVVVGEPAKPR
jgi:hypothetical protein